MTTTVTPGYFAIDATCVVQTLQGINDKLDGADKELVLDFSPVHRIDPATLTAMEALARAAEAKSIKLSLRGVNVELYKVLKLARVASGFSFLN